MKHTTSAGGVVIGPGRRVLVVNQRGNSWSLPKGHVDPGEDLVDAARRETWEESGVADLVYVKPLGSYSRPRIGLHGGDDLSEMKHIHMFLFTSVQEALRPVDAHNPEARWAPPDAVAALLTHPADRAFFEAVIDDALRSVGGDMA